MRSPIPATSLALVVASLSACTPMQWMREGVAPDPSVLEKDAVTCRQDAWREAQFRSWAYRSSSPMVLRDGGVRRFVVWPYGYGPYADPFFEEARLTEFCMRAKGYELVPVEKNDPAQKPPA